MSFRLFSRPRTPEVTAALVLPRIDLLARTGISLRPGDSLGHALMHLRRHQYTVMPVTEDGYFVGTISEGTIAVAMRDGPHLLDSLTVADVLEAPGVVVAPGTSLADAARLCTDPAVAILPIVDSAGLFYGAVTRGDVLAARAGRQTPPRIGGMATPLGVYLYTMHASGGAGWQGLLLTGMAMALMLWIATSVLQLLSALLAGATHLYWVQTFYQFFFIEAVIASPLAQLVMLTVGMLLTVALFMLLLRFFPFMAGYHAAEHQTVNAIEAGEPLTPEAVARMPRAHPRCGTNLLSLIQLTYLGVSLLAVVLSTPLGRDNIALVTTGTLWWSLLVIFFWRKAGAWLQQYVTTRPASRREIASGITAGKEVLLRHHCSTPPEFSRQRFRRMPRGPVLFFRRLWRMGVVPLVLGLIIMQNLLALLQTPLDGFYRFLLK